MITSDKEDFYIWCPSQKEAREKFLDRLVEKDEEGLEVVEVEGKGRGVRTTRPFSKAELVCEYAGELITSEEAKIREEKYAEDCTIGCYMYYFSHNTTKYW